MVKDDANTAIHPITVLDSLHMKEITKEIRIRLISVMLDGSVQTPRLRESSKRDCFHKTRHARA